MSVHVNGAWNENNRKSLSIYLYICSNYFVGKKRMSEYSKNDVRGFIYFCQSSH